MRHAIQELMYVLHRFGKASNGDAAFLMMSATVTNGIEKIRKTEHQLVQQYRKEEVVFAATP